MSVAAENAVNEGRSEKIGLMEIREDAANGIEGESRDGGAGTKRKTAAGLVFAI